LEIILVNDGSTDNSLEILNKWTERDSRIVVINQTNQGASSARNAGLKVMSGAYCGFADADDFAEPEMFEHLYNALIDTGADIASVSIREIYADDVKKERINEADAPIIAGVEAASLMLRYEGGVRTVVWDKLYRRELLDDIRFDTRYVYGEDALFNIQAMIKCEKYARIDYVGYTYDHRASGVTCRPKYRTEQMSCVRGAYDMAEIAKKSGCAELKAASDRFEVMMCRSLFQSILLRGDYKRADRSDYMELKGYAHSMSKGQIKECVSGKEYLQWLLFLHCPKGYIIANRINHIKD
jgi:glycosyltransferase involved in cell wall biosynthesis